SKSTRRLHGNWLTANSDPAVDYTDPSLYHIRFNSNDRLSGGIVRNLTKITVFPGWAWGTPDAAGEIGDIAILQLDQLVTSVDPAVIFPVDSSLTAREVGWGYTDEAGEPTIPTPTPKDLSQIDVPVVANSACSGVLPHIGVGEMCLGGQGGGTCNGDSGSPALQIQGEGPAWTAAIGSVSRTQGTTCGDVGEPTVFTDMWHYVPWMTSVIDSFIGRGTTPALRLGSAAQ
ncbi:trypsin-like serine protease, partial [Streptomyces sp900116325]|uniref:trypsin-like serine protease n=1 Tax=Streptomyces sp. 900116325 TaxID=3154295 RepID=UPI0033CB67DB